MPKSKTATDLLDWLLLYIKAPLAVRSPVQVTSEKSTYAILLEEVGVDAVRLAPPDVYPAPEISPVLVYAVVPGPKDAVSS